jgi:hypothetical protein
MIEFVIPFSYQEHKMAEKMADGFWSTKKKVSTSIHVKAIKLI